MKKGKRMNGFVALMLSVLLLTVLIGCSKKSGSAKGPMEITMWVYSDWTSGKQGELFNRWADEFVAAHPGVNKITMIGKNDNELLTGLMAGVGLPDCFSASFRDGKKYREAIDILDLKPMFNAAEAGYRDGFIQEAISIVQADGGMWALPFMSYIPIVFRNLNVLEKAGINPADGTPDFDVFLEQLQKIKNTGIDGTHSWALDWYTAGAILAGEESLTVGVKDGKTTIKPEQLVPTFEMILKLKPLTNNLKRDDQVAIEAFKTNKLGFIIEGPWNVEGYDASGVRFDIVPVPALYKGGRNGGLRGWDAIYGHDTGDEAKNELVALWLKYITDYERQKEFTSYVGRPVLRNDVMSDPSVQQLEVCKVSAKAQLGGINQMDFFRSNVFWSSTTGDMAVQVNNGKLAPRQAAEQMVDAINNLYAEEQ
jgi:multiple sugar transport system substrate-binding protein